MKGFEISMTGFLKKLNIQNKILVSFVPLFIIVIILMSISYYTIAGNIITSKVNEANLKVLRQNSDKLEIIHQNMISVTNIYYLDSDIRSFLKKGESDDYQRYIDKKKI